MKTRLSSDVSKAILDFIRDFIRLNETSLTDTLRTMRATIGEATNLMMLVGSLPADEGNEPETSKMNISSIQRVSNHFSKEVEMVCAADARVGQILSSLMGVISSDDVIYQRINHILYGVRRLNAAFTTLIQSKDSWTLESVHIFRTSVLSDIYHSYSTTEEREIFHGIFGRPKRKEQAA